MFSGTLKERYEPRTSKGCVPLVFGYVVYNKSLCFIKVGWHDQSKAQCPQKSYHQTWLEGV